MALRSERVRESLFQTQFFSSAMIENLHAKHNMIFFFSPVKTFKARASKSLVLMALKVNVQYCRYAHTFLRGPSTVGHTFFDQIIFFAHAKSTIFVPRKHGNQCQQQYEVCSSSWLRGSDRRWYREQQYEEGEGGKEKFLLNSTIEISGFGII